MRTTGLVAFFAAIALAAAADAPRVLPAGKLPDDARLGPPRTLDKSEFPFQPVASEKAWKARKEELKHRVLVAMGLWPMPTKVELKPIASGKVDRDDYTVERIHFESLPGHFVTGNLYRPKESKGRMPGVLVPHGHWPNGRFHDYGPDEARKEIAIGGERFERGGRHPLQASCVHLARMGCVAFHYDMVGYADSIQLEHRPGVRDDMNTRENWGFFSPQADLRLQSMMGLQTWNSIRSLDYLLSLPDVDSARIAVTGSSGGATQTMILCAIDDRTHVSIPVVMVSTAMQGGCPCENASLLRIEAGNVDFAGMFAPKPQRLIGADDWTIKIETEGYPDLRNLYKMLGAEKNITAKALTYFKHNYNSVSRSLMYDWINEHFKLGHKAPVIERDYIPLTSEEISVWDDRHPKPSGQQVGPENERAIVRWLTEDSKRKIDALVPTQDHSIVDYSRVMEAAIDVLIGRRLETVGTVELTAAASADGGKYSQTLGLLTNARRREQVPLVLLEPKAHAKGQTILWIHDQGKAGLFGTDGQPKPDVTGLLDQGFAVAGIDLLYQGEFLADGKPITAVPMVQQGKGTSPWQRYAGYTYGYNASPFAARVHDILTAIHYLRGHKATQRGLHLAGFDETSGPLALAAAVQADDAVHRLAVDTHGFRFANLDRFDHPMFLPGAAKYHDIPGLVALRAPHSLWLAGEKPEGVSAATNFFRRSGSRLDQLQLVGDNGNPAKAFEWIAGQLAARP